MGRLYNSANRDAVVWNVLCWAPIQYVMKNENYFIQDCWADRNSTTSISSSVSSSRSARSVGGGVSNSTDECEIRQDRIFNWLYLTADITNYLTTYLFGIIYDIYGSRAMRLICNVFLFTGSLFGMAARPGATEYLYYPMMFCLGLGSIPLFISNLQIGNLFSKSELVLSMINGIFDAGDGLTIVPKWLAEYYDVKIYYWWTIFCGATLFFAARTVFLMPVQFFDKKLPKSRQAPTASDDDAVPLKETNNNEVSKSSENPETEAKPPVSQRQILNYVTTWKFCTFVPWFLIMDLREKFFLQSVNPWLNWQGDHDDKFTSKYTDLFSLLQLIALPCATFSGVVISWGSWYYKKYHNITCETTIKRYCLSWLFLVIALLTTIWSWMASFKMKSAAANWIIFFLCIFTRTNMYTIWNVWTLTEFPDNAFGRLSGIIVFILGMFSASQQVFLRIAQARPDGWQEVQIGFAIAVGVVGIWKFVVYRRYAERMEKLQFEKATENQE